MTAYGKMTNDAYNKKRRVSQRGTRNRKFAGGAKCNARKRNGELCTMAKGWGTTHPGIGRCKYHGGSTKNGRIAALKEGAQLMGAPKEMNAVEALSWCIKITAGEVEWLSNKIAEIEEKEWTETTLMGRQVNIWAKERQAAVERLAKFSKEALQLGLAERAVRLAESYGTALAQLLKGVLEDLELTAEQKAKAPLIIRKHLVLLEGRPIERNDLKAIEASSAA